MLRTLIIFLLLIGLSACETATGGTPNAPVDNSNTDGVPTPTREGDDSSIEVSSVEVSGDPGSGFGLGDASTDIGFSGQLDGAETLDVSGVGMLNCENSVYVIRADISSFPQVSLILPSGASPDTYTLANNRGDGSVASATVFFEDGRVFASSVEGILIINDLANNPNEIVRGSFDFSASSGAQTINARGEFNFVSSENAVYCQ